MKKQLTVISSVILALVFALAALMCFFYVKKQVRLKDEKIIMQLINGLSADISQFQKKGLPG